MTPPPGLAAILLDAGITGPVTAWSQVAPIVSPMCRAADWTCLHVETVDDACFVKLRHDDTEAEFDAIAVAARHAADAGIGPALRSVQPDAGAMVFEYLAPPWREARLADLADPAVLSAIIGAKRRLHQTPALPRRCNVFAQIGNRARGLANPPLDLLHAVSGIGVAFGTASREAVPCHADGTVSNVMLHPDGSVRLVDFDGAGLADPHYDLGILLNEACALDADWDRGLHCAFGDPTLRDIARCRLYAIADDLLWGLWGLSLHATSCRPALEYLKYAQWRLLRCRMALRHPGYAAHMRQL